jgi:hypothetical protein
MALEAVPVNVLTQTFLSPAAIRVYLNLSGIISPFIRQISAGIYIPTKVTVAAEILRSLNICLINRI